MAAPRARRPGAVRPRFPTESRPAVMTDRPIDPRRRPRPGPRSGPGLRAGAVGVLALALAFAAAVPGARAMAPHKAVYELSLAKARSAQAARAVSGSISFTWRDVCDGWTVDQKARMRVSFGERGTREIAWQYSAWEADDGERFRFFIRRTRAGGAPEKREGHARMSGANGGTAVFEKPQPRTLDLPADTMFPKAHSEAILARAQAGERFLWRHVFDGTGEGNGLFAVNAIVLKELPAGRDLPVEHPLIADQRSWRVQLAFFPSDARESTPESEQVTRLFANGVAGSIEIDYGDFVVDADLAELEALDARACD
jgi:hypothetical protein